VHRRCLSATRKWLDPVSLSRTATNPVVTTMGAFSFVPHAVRTALRRTSRRGVISCDSSLPVILATWRIPERAARAAVDVCVVTVR